MLAPDTVLKEHYRTSYSADERPDAIIYRAMDSRDNRPVLIAELPQHSADALEQARLIAGQVATIQVDGLMPLRDHFAVDTTLYMVVDDTGGQDLERMLRSRGGPLTETAVLGQVETLLGVLEQLHSKKPELLLGDLRTTDLWATPEGKLLLAPFPLVRAIGSEASPYRAPELANPQTEPTTSSDMYAFCAVIYQLLTGWAPPAASQREAGTPLNAPRTLNSSVSTLTEQMVLRGLELKPGNRYQAARELRRALDMVRLMGDRPLGAVQPPLPGQVLLTQPQPQPPAQPTYPQPGYPQPGYTQPGYPPPPVPVPPPGEGAASPPGGPLPPVPPSYPPPAQPAVGAPPPGYPPLAGQPQYAGYAQALPPAAAPAPRNNTCLIAIIALLAVLALAICVIGLYIVFLFRSGAGAGLLPLPGFAADSPTAVAAAANPTAQAPTAAPVQAGQSATTAPAANPGAFSLASSQAITATRTITQSVLGPVSVGPEGAQMAVGVGRQIQLRNPTSLEVQSVLNGHTGNIYTMLFAPKATPQLLASGAESENTVRLWDVTNGTQLRALEGHTGWIRSLAFTPDGKTLATGSTDNTIKLWDVANGTLLRTLTGHTDFLGGIGFNPDGTRLASASRDGSVRMWDVAAGTQRSGFTFTMPADPNANPAAPFWATGLSFSPDGNTIAVGSTDRNIYMLNAETGAELRKFQGHTNWVVLRGLSFSPDGKSVASSGLDGTIRVWNAETGAERTRIDNGLEVLNISWASDSTRLVSSSDESGAIVVWKVDAAQPEAVQSALVGQGLLTALSYSSDGSVLASGGINGIIRLNRLAQNDQRLLTGGAPALNYLTFLQNAQMAALSDDGSVNVVSFDQQQPSQELQGLNGVGVTMAASPDRRLLAVGSAEGRIAVWDVSSGRLLQSIDTQKGRIYSLAFSGDGQKVVAMGSGENPDVSVWDVQSGAAGPRFSAGAEQATALAVQNNGPQIATANRGGTLQLWDSGNGSSIREIRPDRQDVWFSGVAYSPDGSVLATGATDGLVEFWNPGTGERVGAIQVSNGGVLSMTFRSDGAQLAVSTRDGNIHLLEPTK